jgi:hypothetical protein
MSLVIKHYGHVKNRKVIWDIPSLYWSQLDELNGQEVVATFKKRHKKPTPNSYNYYRGVILPCFYKHEMFSSLDNKDEVHEFYLAPKFLSYKQIVVIGGKRKEINKVESLADISDDRMKDFMNKVMGEAHELNITIPPPELAYSKYYEK